MLRLVLMLIFVIVSDLWSTVYYVKTNGNDSNPWTSIPLAWRTIQKAASTLQSGDTVYILAGIYRENITNLVSGTPNSNILFSAYTNGVYVYRAPGAPENTWQISGVNYIKIAGINFTNNSTDGTGYGTGINISASWIIISNVKICRFQNGIRVQGSWIKIKKSLIRNNLYGLVEYTSLSSSYFQSNRIINNQSDGVTHYGASCWDCVSNNVYDGNHISRNGGYGIWFDFHGPRNKYLNNAIYSNGSGGVRMRDADFTTISNNRFIGNSGSGLRIGNWDSRILYIYRNYFYNNGGWAIWSEDNRGWYNVYIYYNRIESQGSGGGIYLNFPHVIYVGIYSNIIKNCPVGIYVTQDATSYDTISENLIYSNTTGIQINSSFNNLSYNRIHKNNAGILISGSQKNYVGHNTIYSNLNYGISIQSGSISNFIYTNSIFGRNQNYGIIDNSGNAQLIKGNYIFKNVVNGIYCTNAVNGIICNNILFSNTIGIGYKNSSSAVFLNSITNNNTGFAFLGGTTIAFSKNNLFPNMRYSFSNASGLNLKITNNWWGSTIASNIKKKIYGMSGYSNFTSYPLFGPFDITPDADTEPPDRIPNLMCQVSMETVKLSWNKNNSSDFSRYSIYRSQLPGTTNLQRSLVRTISMIGI